MKAIYPLTLALLLSACVETSATSGPNGQSKPLQKDWLTGNTYAPDRVGLGKVDPEYPRAGVTYASRSDQKLHIEYFAPDGSFYLWYADIPGVVAGEWKTEGDQTCLRYKSVNRIPLTGKKADTWDCGNPSVLALNVVAMVEGDPYGLRHGTPPAHDLRTCRLPPGMLLKKQIICLPGL